MPHTSESFRQNQQHFEGPTVENDPYFKRALERDTENALAHEKVIKRANEHYALARKFGIPPWFKNQVEVYKKANAPVNVEELYALRSAWGETIYDASIFDQIGIPKSTIDPPRWEIKDYLLGNFELPRFGRKFRNPVFMRMSETSQMSYGTGMYIGLSMSFTEIKESQGALWSPLAYLNTARNAKFGLQRSRRGFLGTTCYGAASDDGEDAADQAITGIYNHASMQTESLGSVANTINADGDVPLMIGQMMADLDKVYVPHKKILITTRGILDEAFLPSHRDTYTGVTDFERAIQNWFDTGFVAEWWVTDQLKVPSSGTVPANSEQQACLICVGEQTVHDFLVYPTQTLPINSKLYEADFADVLLFGNIITYFKADTTNNAFPATKTAADITTDGTGKKYPQGKVDIAKYLSAMRSANA